MTNIGGLSIQIIADVARFGSDMNAIRGKMDSTGDALRKAGDMVKGALGGMLAGLSVAGMGAWINGAIAAADETSKLAQKIGINTNQVAGLQMAFKLSGLESGVMTSSMGRLSKAVGDNHDALKSLGIQTRDTDGNLRSSRDVLGQVSTAFQGMEDGTRKTALAIEIFGKAGANMIPLLNGGAAGLDDMDAMAKKLGLTIDTETGKAAEEFNDTLDLVKMSGQGVATQIAAKLLPTLNSMAGALFESVTEGDRLGNAAAVLSAALRGLFTVGVIGVEVFNTLGKTLGTVGAAVVAFATGEFRRAKNILEEGGRDIVGGWGKSAKTIQKAWDDTGSAAVTNTARTIAAQRRGGAVASEREDLAKSHAAAAKRRDADDKRQKEEQAKRDAALLKLEKEANAERAAMDMRRLKQESDKQAAVDLSIDKAAEMLKAIKDETAMLGLSNTEREITIALLKLEKEGIEKGSYAYETYAEKIRAAIVDREQVKTSIEQAKLIGDEWKKMSDDIGDEWKKMSDDIGKGLTDSLFRAFESGKDFFSTLWDGIKNLFKTTVLKLLIQPVQGAMNSVMGSLMGGLTGTASAGQAGGGAGGAGGGAGGAGGMLSSLSSMSGMLGTLGTIGTTIGTSVGAGIMGTLSGAGAATFGAGATMASGAIGAGSAVGVAGGVGMMAGAAIPWVAAALALYVAYKALKHEPTTHMGSVVSVDASGRASTRYGDDSRITDNFQDSTDKALRLLGGSSTALLNGLSKVFGGEGGFSQILKFAADGQDASIGQTIISRDGQTVGGVGGSDFQRYGTNGAEAFNAFTADVAKATRQAIDAMELPKWAEANLAKLGDSATLDDLAKSIAEITWFQSTLTALGRSVAPLGGVFTNVAALSNDALLELTEFAGGIDAFVQKTQGYVRDYYTEQEQQALAAGGILRQLKEAGIEAGSLGSREDLRRMIDGIGAGVETESGRKQLGALLNVSADFAKVGDFLKGQKTTLEQLAAQSPQLKVLSLLNQTTSTAVDYQKSTADGITALGVTLQGVGQAITSSVNALAGIVKAGQVSIAVAAQATERTLRSWDNGGAMLVAQDPP